MTLLSGWLPSENGVDRNLPALIRAFEEARAHGDDAPELVVVGVLAMDSVRHKIEGEPTGSLKFVAIEALDGARADQVRFLVAQVRTEREQGVALTGVDEAIQRALDGTDGVPPAHDVVGDGAAHPTGQTVAPPPVPDPFANTDQLGARRRARTDEETS